MEKTRQLLWIFLLCSLLVVRTAFAQTTLTQVRDTVVNPDGTSFNGTAVITWNGFTGSNSSGTSPLSTSARIYNGVLSVLLVPTTTAAAGTFYQVIYYNSNGIVTWAETWQVPPSTTPLTLSAVRTSTTEGASSSSGNGSSNSGGGATTSTGVQYATLPIAINQVTSLSAALASINASIATLTTQVGNSSSNSSGTSASAFIDGESPAGAINGSNGTYTLSASPTPSSSLAVFRNGLLQSPGVDYTLSGSTVNFLPASLPRTNDIVTAYYRVPGLPSLVAFVDSEVPSGAINGSNLAFTLVNAPSSAGSLKLFKNGVLLTRNVDYTLTGANISFVNTAVTPQLGDSLIASYRH